jgi:hypothetical protein
MDIPSTTRSKANLPNTKNRGVNRIQAMSANAKKM